MTEKKPQSVLRLLFTGDVSLGGEFGIAHATSPLNSEHPFAEVRTVFQCADIRVGNLEAPLFLSSDPRKKMNLLYSPPESVDTFRYLGFSALSLGNNHITDHGSEGIRQTRKILESNGIACFGAGINREEAKKPAILGVLAKDRQGI